MSDNFYLYVDNEGKMPQLRQRATLIRTHRFFVRYVQNVPVEVFPYPGQTQVWNYASCSYDSLCIIKAEDADDADRIYIGTYDMCVGFLRRSCRYGTPDPVTCIKNLHTGRLMSFVL